MPKLVMGWSLKNQAQAKPESQTQAKPKPELGKARPELKWPYNQYISINNSIHKNEFFTPIDTFTKCEKKRNDFLS